jgi:hypothetical protein
MMTPFKSTLRQWVENFDADKYESADIRTQIEAGWYDWFCKDESLRGKTRNLASKVKALAKSPLIDPDHTRVVFKNNCPLYGNLYDVIFITDLEGLVKYRIIPRGGHLKKIEGTSMSIVDTSAEVYSEDTLVCRGTWKNVRQYFKI